MLFSRNIIPSDLLILKFTKIFLSYVNRKIYDSLLILTNKNTTVSFENEFSRQNAK